MYLLLYYSTGPFPISLNDDFLSVNIRDLYSKAADDNYLFKSNREEYFLNLISEFLDSEVFQEVRAILIDKNLGGAGWYRAIGLAGHIACSKFTACLLNERPIILTDQNDLRIEDPSLKDTLINNFFQTQGFYFRKYEDVFSIRVDKITGQEHLAIETEMVKLRPVELDRLSIMHPYDNRHQSANEWGAMRLAANFGVLNSISFKYPRHLYFKYLACFLKDGKQDKDKSLSNLFNRILLIDDNADCGWNELLEDIFACKVDKRISTAEILAWKNVQPQKFEQYDLIFLDLYLEKGNPDSTSSMNALKFIKSRFPQIPVVIFTASDKAWNLDKILEKGADAMYIKESPAFFRDDIYTLNNYLSFKNTIKSVSSKYAVLKPYWVLIQKILSHSEFNNTENSPRKIRDRIEERLRMFYGLLKKGYEQWDYDKHTFFYSDYELAFMTLWSVLNEIQESKFRKLQLSFPVQDTNENKYYHHPKGENYTRIHTGFVRWFLRSGNTPYISYFIELDSNGAPVETKDSKSGGTSGYFDFKFYANFRQVTARDHLTGERVDQYPFFESVDLFQDSRIQKIFEEKIILQIAFIIDKMNPASKIAFFKSLLDLNRVRNSLYLTHGSNIDPNFYLATEEQKRTATSITPYDKIKDLFNIVAFLLTGDDQLQLSI